MSPIYPSAWLTVAFRKRFGVFAINGCNRPAIILIEYNYILYSTFVIGSGAYPESLSIALQYSLPAWTSERAVNTGCYLLPSWITPLKHLLIKSNRFRYNLPILVLSFSTQDMSFNNFGIYESARPRLQKPAPNCD